MSCPDCFRGQDHFGPTTGSETVMYGLDVYITKPPESSDMHSQNVIVLFSDAFGWGTTNLRQLADSYARRTGCHVLLPDFMYGGALPAWIKTHMDRISDKSASIWDYMFKSVLIVQAAYYIVPFFIRNAAHKRYKLAVNFVSNIRAELPAGAKIGVAGFCWGAHATTRLARCDHISNANQPLIDAAFTAHPSEVKVDDFSGIKVPYSMIIGDIDFAMRIEDVKKVTDILSANIALVNEVVVVPGARHGFAVRANPNDPSEKEMADQAEDQLVKWFRVHLD
ncbi:Alpha/Beta hydrolase protein [Paraphoma chrysanthemicola]|nr:Alpha/Beta hydrolase protein [Paraphoma chrysanthemicola]